jgi:hypothetical protein
VPFCGYGIGVCRCRANPLTNVHALTLRPELLGSSRSRADRQTVAVSVRDLSAPQRSLHPQQKPDTGVLERSHRPPLPWGDHRPPATAQRSWTQRNAGTPPSRRHPALRQRTDRQIPAHRRPFNKASGATTGRVLSNRRDDAVDRRWTGPDGRGSSGGGAGPPDAAWPPPMSQFQLVETTPGTVPPHQLGLVQAVHGFGECRTNLLCDQRKPGRRPRQDVRRNDRYVLGAAIRVVPVDLGQSRIRLPSVHVGLPGADTTHTR